MTEFARLVAADNPLWCAALLTGRIAELGEVLFETPSWRVIRPPSLAEYVDGPDDGDTPYVDAARWVGPNFCRKVAHQAHGRARQAVAAPDAAADAPYLCGLLTLGVAVGAVVGLRDLAPVSYTHLTLPTICSV